LVAKELDEEELPNGQSDAAQELDLCKPDGAESGDGDAVGTVTLLSVVFMPDERCFLFV
jgi:hypothetical protein